MFEYHVSADTAVLPLDLDLIRYDHEPGFVIINDHLNPAGTVYCIAGGSEAREELCWEGAVKLELLNSNISTTDLVILTKRDIKFSSVDFAGFKEILICDNVFFMKVINQ
jgi:hypothetical protein